MQSNCIWHLCKCGSASPNMYTVSYSVCVSEPVRMNTSIFLSRRGLVFISAVAPIMFPKSFSKGPKKTSHSVLPGLWNNNTPGFPITNGERTENMCGQTGSWGRERAEKWVIQHMAKVSSTGARLFNGDFVLTSVAAMSRCCCCHMLAFGTANSKTHFINAIKHSNI